MLQARPHKIRDSLSPPFTTMKDHNIVALANTVRDAGGVMVAPRFISREQYLCEVNAIATYAPGCGLPTHVAGTNGGTMPCGAVLTQFGTTGPYYCAECTAKGLLSPHDTKLPEPHTFPW